MTAKAAMCKAFLEGKTLNIKNGFTLLGITNIPREVSRGAERPFQVKVNRKEMNGTSRWKQPCTWVDYRLHYTPDNREGIIKMAEYVLKEMGEARTEEEVRDKARIEKLLKL